MPQLATEEHLRLEPELLDPLVKQISKWITAEKWPTPAWFQAATRSQKRSFKKLSADQLRSRYIDLESDFRSVMGKYLTGDELTVDKMATAEVVFQRLQVVRPALEGDPDLFTVSSALDLIDTYMVWLYPRHLFEARFEATLLRLQHLRPPGWKRYRQTMLETTYEKAARAALDEATAACNRKVRQQQISSDLQVNRLKGFRISAVLTVAIFVVVAPFITKNDVLDTVLKNSDAWAPQRIPWLSAVTPWLPTLGVLAVGMLGGFLSGLLKGRSSRSTLIDYEEANLKLWLRPLIGGMAALMVFVLLSWNLIPALSNENAGTFFLAAFLSGFSERYFMKLIDVKEADIGEAGPPDDRDPRGGEAESSSSSASTPAQLPPPATRARD